jgi:predicted nucleic acid-binding protein
VILADTDALIDYLNSKGLAQRVEDELARGNLGISAIARYEARCVRKVGPKIRRKLETLLGVLPVRDVDAAVADRAAAIRLELESRAEPGPIGEKDILIAATAIVNGDAILTRNVAHFRRVAGLELA